MTAQRRKIFAASLKIIALENIRDVFILDLRSVPKAIPELSPSLIRILRDSSKIRNGTGLGWILKTSLVLLLL
jgi:hypothetical protein